MTETIAAERRVAREESKQRARAAANLRNLCDEAHKLASEAQAREPSDPFVYDRVHAHHINRIGERCNWNPAGRQ